jgi:hypothetical protein
MWVSTCEGKLVNLDQVQFVTIEGQKLIAVFDRERSALLYEESGKGLPLDSARESLRSNLSQGTAHVAFPRSRS